jgi:thioredoxin-related protein
MTIPSGISTWTMTVNTVLWLMMVLWSGSSAARDTSLVFRSIPYADLFETAQKEKKGVMLYFHFDGCGACMEIEKTTFKDSIVSEFFARQYISFDINTRKGEGIDINKHYNIQLHPTFIFFDKEGHETHRLVGVFSPYDFYTQAKDALLTSKNLTLYKKQYEQGNRDPAFLYEYTYMLRDANELDSSVVKEYAESLEYTDFLKEENMRYIYEFCMYQYQVFLPYHHPAFRFMLDNKELFYLYMDSIQVKTRLVWILNHTIYTTMEENNAPTFFEALEYLKEFDDGSTYLYKESDGRVTGMITSKNLVLSSMLLFYEKTGDTTQYLTTLDSYISKIWDSPEELNNFAWNVYENESTRTKEKIDKALQCSKRSIELSNNYNFNDTYAWLLYISGDKTGALQQAYKSIDIAREKNLTFGDTQKLVDILLKEK